MEWCDLVYAMRSKIHRRLLKLDAPLPLAIQRAAYAVMGDNVLQHTWETIYQSEAETSKVDVESLQSLNFDQDTLTAVPKLDHFIKGLAKRQSLTMKGGFTPHCPLPDLDILTNLLWLGPSFKGPYIAACYNGKLSNLVEWVEKPTMDTSSLCTALQHSMSSYEGLIRRHSPHNPEAWSLMVLGVMELWVACDRLAGDKCPLLMDYDPEIDVGRLQSLLLPSRTQMERLLAVEKYVVARKAHGIHGGIWKSFGKHTTFAVRFFDNSEEHLALRKEIESKAREERETKIGEFEMLKDEYRKLVHDYDNSRCSETTVMVNGQKISRHPKPCARCSERRRASGLSIRIHEWPLPDAEAELKNVVFELKVPEWFHSWREATQFVRSRLLQCSYLNADSPPHGSRFPLDKDLHLRRYFRRTVSVEGIRLLSSVKPHAKTHYQAKKISGISAVDDILFTNASRFKYFDSLNDCFVGELSETEGMARLAQSMTYGLPSGSTDMHSFLTRLPASPDGVPANEVLARQSECPKNMSLAEHRALCSIPLGLNLQWQNILLQVTAPSVDFNKEETMAFVLQCMYQAGPDNETWHRLAHAIPVSTTALGEKMLEALRDATDRIEQNWRCVNELSCYVAIAHRLLSLNTSEALTQGLLAYLSRAREVGLSWVRVLRGRVDGATDDAERTRFRARAGRAALLCADTFNFHDTFSSGEDMLCLALSLPADVADFIECCITIQECHSEQQQSEGFGPILYWRWQHLCVRAYMILYRRIVDESSGALDVAIKRSWVSFDPTGPGWRAASPSPSCRQHGNRTWLTKTSPGCRGTLTVHYCLVTGEMLVNGFPLNRLPPGYEEHPTYATLFGGAVLEVMPGDIVPGLVFSGKKHYAGHEVHLGLFEMAGGKKSLHVRAIKDGPPAPRVASS